MYLIAQGYVGDPNLQFATCNIRDAITIEAEAIIQRSIDAYGIMLWSSTRYVYGINACDERWIAGNSYYGAT